MMMMMIIRMMTITITTTTTQVHRSSIVRDLYMGGAQSESWPPNYLEVLFVFLSPTWCHNNALKLGHDHFHPYLFEFITYYHLNIQHYIVHDADSIFK
jgi:hypothetical protein